MAAERWNADTQWNSMTPMEKLSACMEALGCDIQDIAGILRTKTSRLRRIVDDGEKKFTKWEDAMLYRLCKGVPATDTLTGCIVQNRHNSSPSEKDRALLNQLQVTEYANLLSWRIDRLCREDSRFHTGDVTVALLSVYGYKEGTCSVTVRSPRYLPELLVNIDMTTDGSESRIRMACYSGKLDPPSKYEWKSISEDSLAFAAGRAKSFITSLLKNNIWKKIKNQKIKPQ